MSCLHAISCAALLLVRPVPTQAQQAPAAALHSVDSLFAAYDGTSTPGASVVVISNGGVVLNRSYGMADLERRAPATDLTNYRLASVTKQFTATAVLLLVQEGTLRLDQHVSEVLPGFPAYARAVTIRHLLTHTSGLPAYEDFVPDTQTVQLKDRDVLALLNRADSMEFAPGSRYRYSNSGFVVLGLVVEAVTHHRFAAFLRERIFAPLHMDSTVAFEPAVSSVPRRAYGYTAVAGGFERTDQSATSGTLGDGGIYTSTHDLVAWNEAVDQHILITPAAQAMAWAPSTLVDGTGTRYGFGWNTERVAQGLHVWHSGETRGFTNAIVKYPDRGVTVIVLTNRSGGDPLALAETVAAMRWNDKR